MSELAPGDVVQLGELVLTGVDPTTGAEFMTFDIAGWSGSPASTLAPVQKLRGPGGWGSPMQLASRSLAPSGIIVAPDRDSLRAAADALNAACSLTDTTLSVTEGDTTRTITARRQDAPIITVKSDTQAEWSLALTALDPRKYGTQFGGDAGLSTGLPASSGGRTWPGSWPVKWTGVTTSGVIHVDNPGNTASPAIFRIDGPCPGPRIAHDGSGSELVFASSYVLAAGAFLVIDMERKRVLEGGIASRNQWITSRGWFDVEPGVNDFVFGANSYDPAARLTLLASPAYL